MPKQKTYEHDYEWNGNSQPQKGVNIKEQNPWPTPTFASVKPPSSSGQSTKMSTPVQPPTDLNELRQAHPWQKPQWATVDNNNNKSPQKNNASVPAVAIDRDAIPKPMLKKTPGDDSTNTTAIQASDDAIAAMERKLAAAKQRQSAAAAKASAKNETAEEEAAAQRAKHQSEETKLEQARRVAKEKELERWRATLQERNERDKAKRQQARNGLVTAHGLLDDTAWQKKPTAAVETMTAADTTCEPAIQQDGGDAGDTTAADQYHHHNMTKPVVGESSAAATDDTGRRKNDRMVHNDCGGDDDDDEVAHHHRSTTNSTTTTPSQQYQTETEEDPVAAELARQIAELEWELQQYQ
jgi:hypothetical protein